jgi:hypothetical protein
VTTLHVMFVVIVAGPVLDTAMFGGLLPSGLLVIFGLDVALAALLAISLRAGLVWFGVFLLSVVYAVAIPDWIDPIYTLNDPTESQPPRIGTSGPGGELPYGQGGASAPQSTWSSVAATEAMRSVRDVKESPPFGVNEGTSGSRTVGV